MAGAEVVDRDPDAGVTELTQRLDDLLQVVRERCLGHLDADLVRFDVGLVERAEHDVGEAGSDQLPDRHVDAEDAAGVIAQGLAEHPFTKVHDQFGLFRDRDRVLDLDVVAGPPQQRLDAVEATGAEVDDRLVPELQFMLIERLAQRGVHLDVPFARPPHRW